MLFDNPSEVKNKILDDLQYNPVDFDNNPCKLYCNIPVNINDIPCTEIDPGEARTHKIFYIRFFLLYSTN